MQLSTYNLNALEGELVNYCTHGLDWTYFGYIYFWNKHHVIAFPDLTFYGYFQI